MKKLLHGIMIRAHQIQTQAQIQMLNQKEENIKRKRGKNGKNDGERKRNDNGMSGGRATVMRLHLMRKKKKTRFLKGGQEGDRERLINQNGTEVGQ